MGINKVVIATIETPDCTINANILIASSNNNDGKYESCHTIYYIELSFAIIICCNNKNKRMPCNLVLLFFLFALDMTKE